MNKLVLITLLYLLPNLLWGEIKIVPTDYSTIQEAKEAAIAGETNAIYGGMDLDPPAAPQNLTASGFDGRVELRWDANSEPVLSYYVLFKSIIDISND